MSGINSLLMETRAGRGSVHLQVLVCLIAVWEMMEKILLVGIYQGSARNLRGGRPLKIHLYSVHVGKKPKKRDEIVSKRFILCEIILYRTSIL